MIQKVHFRLTSVTQQRCCLSSLLFSNSGVGSFTSHMNQISESAVSLDLRLFVLIRED